MAMQLQVVGVGFGRTGTTSLKAALERLLGGRCHHMFEVHARPELIGLWTAAAEGRPDWDAVFDGDVACVDWPAAAFWRELVAANPDAVVLLSRRQSAADWWRSASRTIFVGLRAEGAPPEIAEWMRVVRGLLARHGVDPDDEAASIAAYEQHLADVRAEVPAERLVEWTTGDGWEPLCHALDVPVPDEPFPHSNTEAEFRTMLGIDD
jgi:hypothetical protein